MKARVVVFCIGVVALAAILLYPTSLQAANPFEFEIHYWDCPEDAESQTECTWIGEYFRDCNNNWYLEGTQGGNHKVTYREGCNSISHLVGCEIEFPIYGWVDWECDEVFPFPGIEAYP